MLGERNQQRESLKTNERGRIIDGRGFLGSQVEQLDRRWRNPPLPWTQEVSGWCRQSDMCTGDMMGDNSDLDPFFFFSRRQSHPLSNGQRGGEAGTLKTAVSSWIAGWREWKQKPMMFSANISPQATITLWGPTMRFLSKYSSCGGVRASSWPSFDPSHILYNSEPRVRLVTPIDSPSTKKGFFILISNDSGPAFQQ